MKKTKLAVGIMTAVLAAGTLVGCDNTVKYSDTGKIITYTEKDNDPVTIVADDLLKDYYKDSSKFQSIFDAIYSIVVRNYFNKTETVKYNGVDVTLGKTQMEQINTDAKKKVESDKKTAETNADNNGTSYSDEFDAILESKGAEDEDELFDNYVDDLKKETFDNNFYKYHISEIKNGDKDVKYTSASGEKQLWNGYFTDMVPYHVSHILVKVEDGSGTNYANGTISEDNAIKLFDVVDALTKGEDSFGTIARRFSEDTGSAANYGDLGIMDYSTGYVNEFKLGIYAYENFMNDAEGVKTSVLNSNINIPGNSDGTITGIAKSLQEVTAESFGAAIPEIDYSVFKELKQYAKVDKDANGKSVIDDSANFYPRNIIYNKNLNRHSIALITASDSELTTDGIEKVTDATVDKNTGFYTTTVAGQTKNVLSVKTAGGWSPILCVRAGSDYQGIHFIVVNRSPFAGATDEKVVAGVSLDNYYTTYYPEQELYPTDDLGNPLATYINFSSSVTAETKSRADSLVSTLKSYDSDRLNKYIFKKYFEFEGIKIEDSELEDILSTWISRGFDKKEQETTEAWEKTWNGYIDTLRKQNSERTKLVSGACKLAYIYGNGLDANRNTKTVGDIIGTLATAMVEAKEVDPSTGLVFTETTAKNFIKSITIGSGVKADAIKDTDPVSVLFKKEGALCNDGKEHI